MKYKFNAYGHLNIRATHKTALEFTKDDEITLKGDCIVGINSDFELKKLKEFIKKGRNKKIIITIRAINDKEIQENILAELNFDFNSDKEFVIRKTNFISNRTFAISSNKSAFELNRDLIEFLGEKKSKVIVVVENKQK